MMTNNTPPTAPINAIIDLSHWDTVSSFSAIKGAGILGVVHKATQGLSYADGTYNIRRGKALATGLLWGAYHFGTGDDPLTQARHFLDTVKPDAHTLVALDLERNPDPQSSSMTRVQAEAFIAEIHRALGRWPVLYTGAWYIRDIMLANTITSLSNCPLWIASYQKAPAIPRQWTKWTIWQYTDGHNGPLPWTVPGVNACDRNKFNGTADELLTFWGGGK